MRSIPLGIAAGCAIAAGAFMLLWHTKERDQPSEGETVVVAPDITPPAPSVHDRSPPEGFALLSRREYGFSLFYPEHLTLDERIEDSGAHTIVLSNVEMVEGMQIYIVSHRESVISDKRIIFDSPSARLDTLLETTVGGVPALVFQSEDERLGALHEVWFLHGGFLIQVTAPVLSATLLDTVLASLIVGSL